MSYHASRIGGRDRVDLYALIVRPKWMADAACKGQPVEIFVPPLSAPRTETARAFCARCSVVEQCRAFAIAGNEVGVWGGTSTAERHRAGKVVSGEHRAPARYVWPVDAA